MICSKLLFTEIWCLRHKKKTLLFSDIYAGWVADWVSSLKKLNDTSVAFEVIKQSRQRDTIVSVSLSALWFSNKSLPLLYYELNFRQYLKTCQCHILFSIFNSLSWAGKVRIRFIFISFFFFFICSVSIHNKGGKARLKFACLDHLTTNIEPI